VIVDNYHFVTINQVIGKYYTSRMLKRCLYKLIYENLQCWNLFGKISLLQ
jgi:hypothetical protein